MNFDCSREMAIIRLVSFNNQNILNYSNKNKAKLKNRTVLFNFDVPFPWTTVYLIQTKHKINDSSHQF